MSNLAKCFLISDVVPWMIVLLLGFFEFCTDFATRVWDFGERACGFMCFLFGFSHLEEGRRFLEGF